MTYSSLQVCAMAHCTYRQLDYWVRTGLVRPSIADANGSGSRRRWSPEDVLEVRKVALAAELTQGTLHDAMDRLSELLELGEIDQARERHPSSQMAG